jgi:hypothetical protein
MRLLRSAPGMGAFGSAYGANRTPTPPTMGPRAVQWQNGPLPSGLAGLPSSGDGPLPSGQAGLPMSPTLIERMMAARAEQHLALDNGWVQLAAYTGPSPDLHQVMAASVATRDPEGTGQATLTLEGAGSTRPLEGMAASIFGHSQGSQAGSEPRFVDITPTAAPEPTPGFTNPVEEQRLRCETSANRLVTALGDEARLMSQSDQSRLVQADADLPRQALVATIVTLGGNSAALTTQTALFLEEWTRFLREMIGNRGGTPPQPFPMVVTDVITYIQNLMGDASTSTATYARIGKAVAFLLKLGARIEGNVDLLEKSPKRAPAPSGAARSTAREAPGPMYVLLIEKAAKECQEKATEGVCLTPLEDYICHEAVRCRAAMRGAGWVGSRFVSAAELDTLKASVKGFTNVTMAVCSLDKDGRLDVPYFIPCLSPVYEGVCAWQAAFAEACAKRGFMYPDWRSNDPKKGGIADATDYISAGGGIRAAAKKKALTAAQHASEAATGRSLEEQKEDGTSGTHLVRKLVGETTAIAGWPEAQADRLGDWATPADPGDDPKKKPAKKAALSTRAKFYKPKHTMREQIEARTRWALMLQTAYKIFGTDNVTWATEWTDLLPAVPPDELKPFYGEQTASPVPDLGEDGGAFAGVGYKRAAPQTAPVAAGRGAPRGGAYRIAKKPRTQ